MTVADVCDVAEVLMTQGWTPPEPFESFDDWLDSPLPEEQARLDALARDLGLGVS